MSIGQRLKIIRGEISQTDFARRIGSSQSGVSAYEKDQREIGSNTLIRVCTEYNVNPKWLLTGDGEMFASFSESNPEQVIDTEAVSHDKTTDSRSLISDTQLQHVDFTDDQNNEMTDASAISDESLTLRCLRLADDNASLLRQNGDLRVEVEKQKAELERRAARITDLERQLAEALTPQKGQALLGQKTG